MIDSIFKNSMPPAVSDLRAVGVLPRDGPRLLRERRPRLLQPRRVGQPHGRRQVRQAQRLCRPSQRHFEVSSTSSQSFSPTLTRSKLNAADCIFCICRKLALHNNMNKQNVFPIFYTHYDLLVMFDYRPPAAYHLWSSRSARHKMTEDSRRLVDWSRWLLSPSL